MTLVAPQIHTLGFQVVASVEGKKGFQPISQRYTSKSAAEDYCQLAKKQGFKDAFVSTVEGYEPDPMMLRKPKKAIKPKQ